MKNSNNASVDFMGAFCESMVRDFHSIIERVGGVAVGVSGGADSLALCFALSAYLTENFPDMKLHAITVDHGLRPEAAEEAEYVGLLLSALPNVKHCVLKWGHIEKPSARVQEAARKARYDLMFSYMRESGIRHLFLGHHLDDQAETFLFRLSKGSGLDGLACMPFIQERGGVFLCRPMLAVSKQAAIDFCREQKIDYIDDPSNDDDKYARVRLRASMDVLAGEGLTPERLSQVAMRMGRARAALERMADVAYEKSLVLIDSDRAVFNFKELKNNDKEVFLRVVSKAVSLLSPDEGYGVRMNKMERLCDDLLCEGAFRKQTLGGVIFTRDDARGVLIMGIEK